MASKKEKKTENPNTGHRRFSKSVTDTDERAASRGMLYGLGFKKGDFRKSQVGVASTWGMVTPCNMHINDLAEHTARGIRKSKGMPMLFNTITISDGISMVLNSIGIPLLSLIPLAE